MRRRLPSPSDTMRILSEKRTRAMPRPAPAAGKSLAPLIRELDKRFGQGPGALQARWREIVGEKLAAVTEPVKLTKGRAGQPGSLEIKVAGAAAALVQHQSAEILDRVNLFLGADSVARLRIVQGPIARKTAARPDARPAPFKPLPRAPLDASTEADLSRGVQDARDPALAERLQALGRAVLRREGR